MVPPWCGMWGVGVAVSVYTRRAHTHTHKPGASFLVLAEDLVGPSCWGLPQLTILHTHPPKKKEKATF